jgi:hypothetical protein
MSDLPGSFFHMLDGSERRNCSSPAISAFAHRTSGLAAAHGAALGVRPGLRPATDPRSPSTAREVELEASLRRRFGGFAYVPGARQTPHADAAWPVSRERSSRPVPTHAPLALGSQFPDVPVSWLHAHSIRDRLTALANARPTASAMTELASIDPTTLRGEDAITWLQAHERLTSWWASLQAPAIVRAAGSERYKARVVAGIDVLGESATGHVTIADAVREELAAALRLSPATAQARIDSARLLCGPLTATRIALSEGRITSSHVTIIVSAATRLRGVWDDDDATRAAFNDTCDRLQRRVLPVAMRSTLARTRRAAKHAAIAVDPLDAQRRRLRSLSTRDVFVIDELDGVSTLIARMATEHAHACLSVINERANRCEWSDPRSAPSTNGGGSAPIGAGERRSLTLATILLDGVIEMRSCDTAGNIAELRAAAIASRITNPTAGATNPTAGATRLLPRLRADINLVIDLPTLLALRDGTAELVGAGAIPAEVARELLDDSMIRRIVTDPTTGELLDYGRRTYAVPERLREYIVARDRTCRFPGCGTSANRCQIDHAIPWSRGGETNRDNLGALCIRHHQLKTHGGWNITESDSHGGCTWLSPQGRQYEHVPGPMVESLPSAVSQAPVDVVPGNVIPGNVVPDNVVPDNVVHRLNPAGEHFPGVARDGPT